MSSYQTVPDLESAEAQPLVAAPPRKLGKTLLVVALFGFAAGAAAATAAPHVAAKMNFAATGGESDVAGATGQRKSLDNPYADVAGENGTPSVGVTEPAGGQFKMTDASVNTAAAASAEPCPGGETAGTHCSGKAIEAAQNGPDLGV